MSLENNPYEKADDPFEKIHGDLKQTMDMYFQDGGISRPGFAEALLTIAQEYEEFARHTE
jgi:hypothetical protein